MPATSRSLIQQLKNKPKGNNPPVMIVIEPHADIEWMIAFLSEEIENLRDGQKRPIFMQINGVHVESSRPEAPMEVVFIQAGFPEPMTEEEEK